MTVVMEERRSFVWAYRLLYLAFIIAPILAGLDKFFNILTQWDMYLSPAYAGLSPWNVETTMKIVGVIEIIAGFIVFFKPRIGGFIVSVWLLAIILNLFLIPGFNDIALRDFGLSLGAAALALLSRNGK